MLSQGLFRFFLPARKLGLHNNLEGDKGRTTDPLWLKGYFLFFIICWTIKLGRVGCWFPAHCSGTQQRRSSCIVHHMISIISYHYFPFLFCPVKLSSSEPTRFFFNNCLSHPTGEEVRERLCGVYLSAGLNQSSLEEEHNLKAVCLWNKKPK